MFGVEFFPTPAGIASKMIAPYAHNNGLFSRVILEPSAGRGDVVAAINKACGDRRYGKYIRVDCCEIDLELAAILKEKGCSVVSHDFLSFRPVRSYDLIVMNPPFSNGAEHLLHAWDILDGGDIVCLLNEETILNPCTKRRVQLARLIKRHGEVEYLGDCFSTADRKTGVRVAMVRLHKESSDKFRSMFEAAGLNHRVKEKMEKPESLFLPAGRDLVGAIVTQYNEACTLYKQMLVIGARLDQALKGARGAGQRGTYSDGYVLDNLFPQKFSKAFNSFADGLAKDAWSYVIRLADLDHLMTASVREEFNRQIEQEKTLAFDKCNIFALLDGLRHNVESIQRQALCDVFDYLTKYYHENREYFEGWKTNERFKVGLKFILPDIVKVEDWGSGPRFDLQWGRNEGIRDIDRVMASLEGRKVGDIYTIEQALRDSFPALEGQAESEYFTMRYFKKGTVHFKFKDESLRERFCIEYAKDKNWLPENYSYDEDGPMCFALEAA